MKMNCFRILNLLLLLLLSALGFVSCLGDDEYKEYGTPTAVFIFRGTVTDGSGNGLPNVKVSYVNEYNSGGQSNRQVDSLTITNEEGKYEAKWHAYSFWDEKEGLLFSDEDGNSVDTFLKYSDLSKPKGGDGKWFEGYSENTLDIKMDILSDK